MSDSSVLERTESDLYKINWLVASFYLISIVFGALRQVSIVSHSYQNFFGFLGSDFNLDNGLRDQLIMRFVSVGIKVRL